MTAEICYQVLECNRHWRYTEKKKPPTGKLLSCQAIRVFP